jgi:hypothetical protein
MEEYRITAGELRECNIQIPENIPDVASIRRSDIRWEIVPDSGYVTEDKSFYMQQRIIFDGPFEWIKIDIKLKPAKGFKAFCKRVLNKFIIIKEL